MPNTKAYVPSSCTGTRGLSRKQISLATCAKLKAKRPFSCFAGISIALYSLLTLCREGNGWVSKAEFSSSLKDAEKKIQNIESN